MILALSLACAPDTDSGAPDTDADPADHRVEETDVDELGADQALWVGAEFTVEPAQDVMTCGFGTYTGETVGLHDVYTYQGLGGHHLQIMGTTTPAIDVADGTVVDCTKSGGAFSMADLEPIGITNGGRVDGEAIGLSMPLPEGMAFQLESGQRYVMQSHYINTTQEAFTVRDLAVLTLIPAAEVAEENWAAPVIYTDTDFSIPPASAATASFDCTTERDWNLLYVLGHMHEWGTAFALDRVEADGSTVPFYSIPEWDPVYRDAPMVEYFPDGSQPLPAGTTFRTTCEWFNDTDEALAFPNEMCVTVNIVYPQKATVVCSAE